MDFESQKNKDIYEFRIQNSDSDSAHQQLQPSKPNMSLLTKTQLSLKRSFKHLLVPGYQSPTSFRRHGLLFRLHDLHSPAYPVLNNNITPNLAQGHLQSLNRIVCIVYRLGFFKMDPQGKDAEIIAVTRDLTNIIHQPNSFFPHVPVEKFQSIRCIFTKSQFHSTTLLLKLIKALTKEIPGDI